ncbi:Prenylcysteine oxidase [Gryllus bimaculatus]|nr:Prenylcysteine oxidase [Gryllus bimaculatus]
MVANAEGITRERIIGGGIGGSSAAYFLQELFGENNLTTDVFEYNRIGGRLATEVLKGNYYEAGGAIIHPRNKYMSDFVALFDLKKRNGGEPSAFGLYDGEDFVFSESSESWQLWNAVKLLWRYGIDTFKLKSFIDDMLDHFSRIYTLQDEGVSFESVEEMLFAMNKEFVKYLHVSSEDGFRNSGFSERVISAVSVAGGTPGLWAVEGGNYLVAEKLLEASNATLIKGQVMNVTLLPGGEKFQLFFSSPQQKIESRIYDIVILAAPVAANVKPNIQFSGFPSAFTFPGKYHQTVCTILKGDLNNKFFKLDKYQIQEILSINGSLFFNSIGRIYPVNSKKKCDKCFVWKIFSQMPLQKEDLQKLFVNIEEMKTISWRAYPHYDTKHFSRNFVLYKNLFHINAIEWAASAMEMSAVGAKNVALLAYKNWFNHTSDAYKQTATKEEL